MALFEEPIRWGFDSDRLLVVGGVVQLTLETSAELTTGTFADNDVGILPVRSRVALVDVVDLDPATMLVRHR